ncbi:peptide chain release factor N(5)-glutamine methyltransferase [Thiothrix litoralis]|uniref:Release factor glutamine methyltransferase n=1 Tax=Thiothrix litoralis TaxID=2891210 RepID=A0ABX7X0Z3_9GAMM|nr:peptide chain release factor N(5)-glutamine methyltransferase [Thiothrix litoralis]
MNNQALLADAVQQLQTASESARADAEILLAHCLQKSRTYLFAYPETAVDSLTEASFRELLAERLRGVPIAHITGQREFWTLNLKVTPDTLIPRPETELLVETALKLGSSSSHILDLGTGTGAIAIAIASERPDVQVTACDFSAAALAVAQENAQVNSIHNVHFIQSDWFSALPAQRFDMIVSNPPYIEADDPHLAQGDVRFEPLTALASGQDGLDDIRHLIQTAPQWLVNGGWLLLEHGYNQGQAVTALLQAAGFTQVRCLPDLAGNDRVSRGQWLTD